MSGSQATHKRPRLGFDEADNDVVAGASANFGRTVNCSVNKTLHYTVQYRPPYETLWSLKKKVFGSSDPVFGLPTIRQYFGRLESLSGTKDSGYNLIRAYDLQYIEGATVDGVAGCNLPMHIIDLTSRLNTTAGLTSRAVMHSAHIKNGAPDQIVFLPMSGRGNDGTTPIVDMQRYSAPLYTDFDKLCDDKLTGSLMKNISLDFMFQGPSSDAEICVDIVQFDEEETEPFAPASAEKSAFWWNYVHKYISNPINRVPRRDIAQGATGKIKVLHRENIFLAGSASAVADTRSRAVCKMNFKTDHLCSWLSRPHPANNPGIAQWDNPNIVQPVTVDDPSNGNICTYLPDFRHRIYAIIRGTAVSTPTDGTANNSTHRIGYDMRLITTHQIAANHAE